MVLLMVASSIFGQVPLSFKYQAVLRDARGNTKANIATQIAISVLKENANGTVVFSETHSATTDGYGLINLEIGKGTPKIGTLSGIDWGTSSYFIKVNVDGVEMGTSQLLSVPYALYAKTAGNVTGSITETDPVFTGSQAAIITANHITKLNNLSGVNTGDQNLSGLATTASLTSALGNKVDKIAGKGLSANDYTTTEKTKLTAINGTNNGDQDITAMAHSNRTALDAVTGKNTGDQNLSGLATISSVTTTLNNKVDKVAGKGLSANDYTTAEKTKLKAITGSNTGDQDVTAMTHSNRVALDSVTGKNTGDQDLASVLMMGTDAGNKKIVNVNQMGVGTSSPDISSALEIKSTTQGFLPPRMTYVQKLAIVSPATGLIIWCSNCGLSGEIQVYNGTTWTNLIGEITSASLPVISLTTAVNSITKTTATSGGNVTSDGGALIKLRGVCWSTKVNPTAALSTKTIDGTGAGVFSSSLTGLSADSTYYVRAYATNSTGTAYGSSITFSTITNHVAPTITTIAATNIAKTTATSGGNVTSDGGATIIVRGVCWSTSVNPTIALNTKTTNGTGTGIFSSSLTGLSADSTYYVRAYATNSAGTAYGSSITFSTITNYVVPTLSTSAATNVAQTTATSGGNVTSDGGATITVHGVCWSTSTNPTIALNTKTTDEIGSTIFTSKLTGLSANTIFYVRAYATNSVGTGYGSEVTFKTAATVSSTVTDIDGNVYSEVTIGTQVWMVGNLKTTKYRNGDPIPNVTNGTSWAALNTGAYCWYNNDLANKADYGALYNAYSVADTRNIAPIGWHVSTFAEWTTMIKYLGDEDVAGNKLAEKGTLHWVSPNNGATNESGFTALPGGACNFEGQHGSVTAIGYWWTSTESDLLLTMAKRIYNSPTNVGMTRNTEINAGAPKKNGFSVRCVKDVDPANAEMPTLNTTNASIITNTSANCGGNISNDGRASIISRGVCWNTSSNPTIALNTKTSDGAGTGIFSSSLSGLTAGTTYYVRAYATNSAGTSYGSGLTFTTLANPVVPTLSTTAASNITQTTATSGGNVTADGGATITARGVCWSTSANPTIELSTKTSNGTGTGLFLSSLAGLKAGTTYYLRSYATNSIGTGYGSKYSIMTSFASDGSTIMDIDGNVYSTITIGTQVWMVENLKTTKYRDGSNIPNVTDNAEWSNLNSSGYCWYNNDISNKNKYGALYNWFTLNTEKLAPTGWHVPNDIEWGILQNYLINNGYGSQGDGTDIAKSMAATSGWSIFSTSGTVGNDSGSNNSSGFSALPGGSRDLDGTFRYLGNDGVWWQNSKYSTEGAWSLGINFNSRFIYHGVAYMLSGYSVRCVKD